MRTVEDLHFVSTVDKHAQIKRAIGLAWGMEGVQSIGNEMNIKI